MGTAQQQTWFITGAARGFGLEIARAALARGDAVVAAARDPQAVTRALGRARPKWASAAPIASSACRSLTASSQNDAPAGAP